MSASSRFLPQAASTMVAVVVLLACATDSSDARQLHADTPSNTVDVGGERRRDGAATSTVSAPAPGTVDASLGDSLRPQPRDSDAGTPASVIVRDSGILPCAASAEAQCTAEGGCVWTGQQCLARCQKENCPAGESCDFVSFGQCGLEQLCVPSAKLASACQLVPALCGPESHRLCLELHGQDFSDCEVGDDVPQLFCAFSPEGVLYALSANYQDVLVVEQGWTRSGSYFSESTLTARQQERCDALRPVPSPSACPARADAGQM